MGYRKLAAAAAVLGVAGFTAAAVAGDPRRDFNTDMTGFEEVPSVSTTGGGQVDAQINRAGTEIRYTLRYRNLEGKVQQSHIHFGQEGVNGGIVVFLCSNLGNGTANTPPCPDPPATVTGTLTAADVSAVPASAGAVTQGIGAGEFDELVRAMRAGVTYANVHSDRWPGGEIRGQLDREGHGQDD
jgi:CHRD domain-containing protein